VRDLGNAIVLPGLVNAHTHLELSWLAGRLPADGDYLRWMRELLRLRADETEAEVREAARRQILEMQARGTVAVGDVANRIWTGPELAASTLHGIQFQELYGFRTADAAARVEEAIGRLEALAADPVVAAATERLRVILTPHATHTTSARLLRALAGRAIAAAEPLSIHVAESRDEVLLLDDGSGRLPELYREREFWDETWQPPGQSPVEYLNRLGVLSPRTLAVHCVHLGHQDLSMLQAREVTVVTCPRSNERLGVGTAPIPQLLGAGVPVALGTDSLASAPDLDVLAEIAALRRIHPAVSPAAALRMATFNGARALGLDSRLGSIEVGKLAALAVVPLPSADADPLQVACSGPAEAFALELAPREPDAR